MSKYNLSFFYRWRKRQKKKRNEKEQRLFSDINVVYREFLICTLLTNYFLGC